MLQTNIGYMVNLIRQNLIIGHFSKIHKIQHSKKAFGFCFQNVLELFSFIHYIKIKSYKDLMLVTEYESLGYKGGQDVVSVLSYSSHSSKKENLDP